MCHGKKGLKSAEKGFEKRTGFASRTISSASAQKCPTFQFLPVPFYRI
jgi:hypothetical protein